MGAPTPVEADPAGTFYAFERGAEKLGGGGGWADVWYRENLENPSLLVVSNLDAIEVYTDFTCTSDKVHPITLETITEDDSLRVLRALFFVPQSLRPIETPEAVNKEPATRFGDLAQSVQERGNDPHGVAHFLVLELFCLFSEEIRLLPNRMFSRLLDFARLLALRAFANRRRLSLWSTDWSR